MSALPHVVWDMGGVMYEYFTQQMVIVGHERGWPMHRMPMGPSGDVPDADYAAMLAGEFGEPEYIVRIRARLAAEGIDFRLPEDLHLDTKLRPETWEAVRLISEAGHRQAVLTNDATRWLGEGWWDRWEPARWFDAMIDVVMVGARKPAPEPYLAAAEALAVPPAECLFVDDLPVNCRGAEAVGMESHLFDVTEPVRSIDALLERLGVTEAA